jgi:FkbM family methyltransferase
VVRLSDWPDASFLIPAWDEAIRPHVQVTGEWERDLIADVASRLGRRPRIVVAGGHVGLSAFQLWRARPRAREISVFEPDPVCAALLALNADEWKGARVRLWPLALAAAPALLELVSNPANSADNRLWRPTGELTAGGGDPQQWRRQRVLAMPLDQVRDAAPLDLVFLDAQGFEPEILRGAGATIRRWRPLVAFEWWPRALAARGLDPHAVLGWVERELALELVVHGDDRADLRELTEGLLAADDTAAHAQLVATPRGARSASSLAARKSR